MDYNDLTTGAGENWELKNIEVEWAIPTTLDGSEAGRVYYIKLNDVLIIETPDAPYYRQIAGGEMGWNYEFNIFIGSEASNGNEFRISTKIVPDKDSDYSNVAVYKNGIIQELSQIGEYLVEFDDSNPTDQFFKLVFNTILDPNDRIVFIVSNEPRLENFLTTFRFYEFIGNVDKILTPADQTINIGKQSDLFNQIFVYNVRTNYITPMDSQPTTINGNFETTGDLTVQGNLQVQGNTITTEDTQVSDSSFEIKHSNPALDGDASFQVQRASGNAQIRWNDTNHMWQLIYGENANITSNIITEADGNVQSATKLFHEPTITLSGDINGSVLFDGTTNVEISTTLQVLSELTVDNGSESEIHVVSNDDSFSSVNITGRANGTGRVFVGAEPNIGGGVEYNHDSTPVTSGAGDQNLALYRRYLGQDFWTAKNNIQNNNWEFRGEVKTGGALQIANAGKLESGNNNPNGTKVLGYNGYFYATRVYNAVWNDLAEFMLKAEDVDPGKIVVQTSEGVRASKKRADKTVVGVHSDSFGYALGASDQETKLPVGISGVVWVYVNCKVKPGDELVSDTNGCAVKANMIERIVKRSSIIGKVLQPGEAGQRVKTLIR